MGQVDISFAGLEGEGLSAVLRDCHVYIRDILCLEVSWILSLCAAGLCTLFLCVFKTIASQYEHFESISFNDVHLQLIKVSVTLSWRSGKIELCSRRVIGQSAAWLGTRFLLMCVHVTGERLVAGRCLPTYIHVLTYVLNYLLTYIHTPCSRVILQKLAGSQLDEKFSAFYGTRRFISSFTRARHLPSFWAKSIQSMPPFPHFVKIRINIILLYTNG
jgi:hypothetical protein